MPRAGDRRTDALKIVAFAACAVPFARLVALGFTGGLGANPVEFVTRSTGTWTLVMLCVTLAVTPLRRLTGWNRLARLRRMFGLWSFFYACLHFTTWFWLDQWFDVASMLRDVVKRPFITAGFTAFVLLVPLAATSTDAMMRRLGRRWSRLHRLVYAIAAIAILHFWWMRTGKNLLVEPAVYGGVVAVLLGARLWWRLRGAFASARASAARDAPRT